METGWGYRRYHRDCSTGRGPETVNGNREVIFKTSTGGRPTHNGDGNFRRVWRLWSDGQVERTSSRSKYQAPFRRETVPPIVTQWAHDLGLTLWGFRNHGQSHTSETPPSGQGGGA